LAAVIFDIRRGGPADAPAVANLTGELLAEIMEKSGVRSFNFDLDQTTERLRGFLEGDQYVVFLARAGENEEAAGFIALCESCALYAEGRFGIVPELFVKPPYRCRGLGAQLIENARAFGLQRGWRRLEVTTPPLPEFERTLLFYQREGFAVSGGRKLRSLL